MEINLDALAQAEEAATVALAGILDLDVGTQATPGISIGQTEGLVFDIGELGTGDTVVFPASVVHMRSTATLFNRNRIELQKWIVTLLNTFPINKDYAKDHDLRETSNIIHLRIPPERGAVSKCQPDVVENSNSGEVNVWTCDITFDTVITIREE